MRRHPRTVRVATAAFGVLLGSGALAAPEAMQERLSSCIACHGGGTSETEGVPSLGGQMPDYVVTQLFQFREKQREAAPMNEVAAGFSDDDLRTYADAIAALPAPDPSGSPAAPNVATRAQAVVAKHQCSSCHGADLAGRDAIPRIRGQREDYLVKALAGYKSNARPGYDPAMNEVAQGLSEADIKDLAAYVSRL
jgi:cytochrome c553